MLSKCKTQHKISILRKLTASPPKTESENKRKTILKSRIKQYFEKLDLYQVPKENMKLQLKFVPRYGDDTKSKELRRRYNIIENAEYAVVKIHNFGVNRRVREVLQIKLA